jgi:hypothetical protein
MDGMKSLAGGLYVLDGEFGKEVCRRSKDICGSRRLNASHERNHTTFASERSSTLNHHNDRKHFGKGNCTSALYWPNERMHGTYHHVVESVSVASTRQFVPSILSIIPTAQAH